MMIDTLRKLVLMAAVATVLTVVSPVAVVSAEDAAAAAPVVGAEEIVAEYAGKKITGAELAELVAALNPRARKTLEGNSDRVTKFLENHIVSQLIFAEGKRSGVDQSPEVRKQLEDLERHLVVQRVMQEQQSGPVPDETIRAYYDEHLDEFTSDRIKASHILVAEEELANEIQAKLKADPSQFESLALEHSTDRSNSGRGGDLGFFARGRMVKEFEDSAFLLTEDGQISEPVKTRFGFHIIKRTGREDGTVKPFEDVENQIKMRLVSEKRRASTEAFLAKLKSDAGLVVHTEALAKVELPVKGKGGEGGK